MGIVLFFPHVMKDAYRKTGDIADKMELTVKDRKITKIKPEMLEILHYEIDNPLPEEFLDYIFNKDILIFLMKLADTDTRAPEEVLHFFWKTVACASSELFIKKKFLLVTKGIVMVLGDFFNFLVEILNIFLAYNH